MYILQIGKVINLFYKRSNKSFSAVKIKISKASSCVLWTTSKSFTLPTSQTLSKLKLRITGTATEASRGNLCRQTYSPINYTSEDDKWQ